MSLGMIPTVRESFELDAAIVTPIGSNPEHALKQPVDGSSPLSPGNVVAPASGACAMLRDPPHSESPTGNGAVVRRLDRTSVGQGSFASKH